MRTLRTTSSGGWLVLGAAAAAVLVSLALTGYLLFAPVSTTGIATEGWKDQGCGRPALILNDGTAYDGGEYRPNQDEFDDACVRISRERAGLAATTGTIVILGSLPLGFVVLNLSRGANTPSPRTGPRGSHSPNHGTDDVL